MQITIHIITLLICAIIFNSIMVKSNILKIPNVYFGTTFLIFSMPLIMIFPYVTVSILCLLFGGLYYELITLKQVNNKYLNIFNAGIILGISLILDYNLILLYFFACLILAYYKELEIRTILILLLGSISIIPLYYFSIELSFFEKNQITTLQYNLDQLKELYLSFKFFLFLCLILFGVSLSELYKNYYKKSEYAKKAFSILIIMGLLIVLNSIIFQKHRYIFCLIIPLSILITNYLIYIKRPFFRTILLGLLLLAFFIDSYYFII
ncbi:MAG: hypothetical protein CMP65_03410 [Flavobacteriales bacterium]|nr:hypothetical protein [Flavobacteriales bacterium]